MVNKMGKKIAAWMFAALGLTGIVGGFEGWFYFLDKNLKLRREPNVSKVYGLTSEIQSLKQQYTAQSLSFKDIAEQSLDKYFDKATDFRNDIGKKESELQSLLELSVVKEKLEQAKSSESFGLIAYFGAIASMIPFAVGAYMLLGNRKKKEE